MSSHHLVFKSTFVSLIIPKPVIYNIQNTVFDISILLLLLTFSVWGTSKWGDGYPKISFSDTAWNELKKGFKRQVQQGFSSIFTNFLCIFDDFSKWSCRCFKILKKSSNRAKIWQKNKHYPKDSTEENSK